LIRQMNQLKSSGPADSSFPHQQAEDMTPPTISTTPNNP
jgi:hypothetical protein